MLEKEHTLIIDIGKTHVKLHVLDESYQSVFATQMTNTVDHSQLYPCTDVDKIWDWLCKGIKSVSGKYSITRITTTTHGATAALIDRDSVSGNGLVLPVLDYESNAIFEQSEQYQDIREPFKETFSPSLPAGLNLGRQLYWIKQHYAEAFSRTTDVLMYPQYWGWRFTGSRYSEITSLGCHTDLWSIANNDFSALVDALECRDKFPPLKPAWQDCGVVSAQIAKELGLHESCTFYSGIHDSNASFLRYRLAEDNKPFTVISTGTWTILMATQVSLENLDAKKDMLANIDALGSPVACARFMGGREFEAICEQAGSWLGEQFNEQDLQRVIDKGVFALPNFSDGSGPFGNRKSEFVGPIDKVSGIALATLYCALMIDYQLNQLGATGQIYIEGAFLKNPLLCAVVNQLRTSQEVCLSVDNTGTVLGAAYLTHWGSCTKEIELSRVSEVNLQGLEKYKTKWLAQADDI